jgi:glycosyltransferase involved in cell wall biosynthesis
LLPGSIWKLKKNELIEDGMHILLIHQAFAALDEAGGTRHYEMARHLVEHGHRVTIIASPVSYLTGAARTANIPWCEEQHPETGITLLRCYVYPFVHKSFFHRLLGFFSFMFSSFWVGLSVKDVDLVWGTTPPIFQGATAWLLARLKGKPFLLEVRDLWPAFAIAVGVLKNPLLIRMSLWLENFLYRHADQVIINSPGFFEHVTAHGARNVRLIPNGVDTSMFNPALDGSIFRKEHQLEDRFVALYAGAHGLSNDLGILLQAAALTPPDKKITYVLVGDGKEKGNLQQQATEMGLENVLFLPSISKNEIPQVLAGADVCIAILKPLELYKTTYPNKVFDYLAAARPVVLAIDGVIREVVEKAKAGIAVPPGDASAMAAAVIAMAKDPQDTRAMGKNGREYIELNFDRKQISEEFCGLLEELRK